MTMGFQIQTQSGNEKNKRQRVRAGRAPTIICVYENLRTMEGPKGDGDDTRAPLGPFVTEALFP